MFKAVCPLASQMLVHGDGRNYATALIALDPDALAQWGRAQGLTATDYAALAADPAVHAYVRSCVDELNGRLNRWETIKDFRILDHDLSVEGGRADAEHEGQAEGHRGEVPGAARLDVCRVTEPSARTDPDGQERDVVGEIRCHPGEDLVAELAHRVGGQVRGDGEEPPETVVERRIPVLDEPVGVEENGRAGPQGDRVVAPRGLR